MAAMASFSACQWAFMPSADSRRLASSSSSRARRSRGGVGLLGQGDALDLQLTDAPVDDVDLGGHGVDLDPQPAGRLVHQVDRLVGEEPGGDVAVRQDGRRHQRRVHDPHPVVDLVALLQAPQDGDGVLDGGLAHVDRLETPLQGRIFLDVLAVLVQRRGPDHAQLAPGQHGLDHVAGVHGALRPPPPRRWCAARR